MTVSVPSSRDVAARWGQVLGITPDRSDVLHLDDATVRFVASTGGDDVGISHIDVATPVGDRVGEEHDVLGVRIRFVGAR